MHSRLLILVLLLLALLSTFSWAQGGTDQSSSDKSSPDRTSGDKASRDKAGAGNGDTQESSSRDTRIDIRPPKDDEKSHPSSQDAVADLDTADKPDSSDVQEFHPWNPLKAKKDVEVGDFYYKRKNYKAALERYKEALYYKDGDAVASFRVALCQEKLGNNSEATKYFEQYLKILPEGPLAKEAHSSLDRMAKK